MNFYPNPDGPMVLVYRFLVESLMVNQSNQLSSQCDGIYTRVLNFQCYQCYGYSSDDYQRAEAQTNGLIT
jgi:hypothetical protein